ncbi:hypothetical protein GCM10010236_76460 [Streptomyces eurythermus]|nr:hypothetical protein GCM10010236_76460 [Streptomyces eurythermus]
MRSGTSGRSSTIACGSGRGTCGTDTSPAPSRPRAEEPVEAPELRTDTRRPVDFPDTERDSRPDTERRERDDCEDVRALREPAPSVAPLATPVACETTIPAPEEGPPADTTGARPQVSQYSPPPPTSS